MANNFSEECKEILKLLTHSRNVLLSGPPGTGKSRLLAEVAVAFANGLQSSELGGRPVHHVNQPVPIPPSRVAADPELVQNYPAPSKRNRKVFRTVFHQNSKHRDFLTGILPVVVKTADQSNFRIIRGTLYQASEFAKNDGASLLIIDEINRGPAVQIFGGSIVAIESEKRLDSNGSQRNETQYFEIMDPGSGDIVEYALPSDLFILAAMNQADASIEPLDVAFLRRWEPVKLEPNVSVLKKYYGLRSNDYNLPQDATETEHVLEASLRAWLAINTKISLGRGSEFQIGHGVLIYETKPAELSVEEAKAFVSLGWAKIRSHIEEVFFGDIRSIAATLNALEGPADNPFKLVETTFADNLRYRLDGPTTFKGENIYSVLRAIAHTE